MTLQKFVAMYLDWRNNFLTIERFAEYYGITVESAQFIINTGRSTMAFEPENNYIKIYPHHKPAIVRVFYCLKFSDYKLAL